MNGKTSLKLFACLSCFLFQNLNLGGEDGAELSDELILIKMNLALDMLRILVQSEIIPNNLAITNILSTKSET